MSASDDLEFKIARLDLEPGDILVAKLTHPGSQERADHTGKFLRRVVGEGVKVVVINDGIELSVLRLPEKQATSADADDPHSR